MSGKWREYQLDVPEPEQRPDPMPEVVLPKVHMRAQILEQAAEIVSSDRNVDYGDPEQNFEAIAQLWTVYKSVPFEAHDVAVMQMLVKVARIRQSPAKMDHWVDIAGYAACGGEVAK